MVKTNLERLVEVSVLGEIVHPRYPESPVLDVGYDGTTFLPVGMGGITYNVKVGDPAFGWAWGDHIEPGASIKNGDAKANSALNHLAAIGNDAVVIHSSGDTKDAKVQGSVGTVTGKHGGCERVLVYFPKKVLDRLCIGDRIQIRASGMGLALPDHPDVKVLSCGPKLLKALNLTEKGGRVRIRVAKIVPGKIMGSGLGATSAYSGDYDIQSTTETVKEYSLDNLRLGDLVAIQDHDASFGYRWMPGAVTVGVVIHGASRYAGHGPGVTALFTSPGGKIEPIIDRKANLADLLGLA